MSQNETISLPVAGFSASRPSLRRYGPPASFISQLLAERNRLPPQRVKRRETPNAAVDAYAAGAKATLVRMPAGYRRTVVV